MAVITGLFAGDIHKSGVGACFSRCPGPNSHRPPSSASVVCVWIIRVSPVINTRLISLRSRSLSRAVPIKRRDRVSPRPPMTARRHFTPSLARNDPRTRTPSILPSTDHQAGDFSCARRPKGHTSSCSRLHALQQSALGIHNLPDACAVVCK